MSNNELKLYTAWYCPYAQRTWAFIEHLGMPYNNINVDPYVKSPEWMATSRDQGTVPVIQVSNNDEDVLSVPGSIESMEFLVDLKSEVEATSQDPVKRADQKFWLGYIDRKITPAYYRVLTKPARSDDCEDAKQQLELSLLEIIKGAPLEKWFSGNDAPGLIDFALAPFAMRMELLYPKFREYSLPKSGTSWQAYSDWLERIINLPAFIASAPDQETYEDRLLNYYSSYAEGKGHQGA